MKALSITLALILIGCTPVEKPGPELSIMTFNIRLNLPSDAENAWPNRKDMAASMIHFYSPDMFGVQEAFEGQVNDLADRLPEYAWIGVGRDDGQKAGEYMAIFYLKKRFKLLNEDTFWLSEHPEKPGRGWDAAYNRVVTWGQFSDLKTARTFYHFNTHFDNRGELARQESARLILKKIEAIAGELPLLVTGDFNAYPDSEPYKILTHTKALIDAKTISATPHHGPSRTFNGFDLESLKTAEQPIDYIFVNQHIKVLKHATLSDTFDGYFPSDHMPVIAQIIIEP